MPPSLRYPPIEEHRRKYATMYSPMAPNAFDHAYPNFDARGQELIDFGRVASADLELAHFLVSKGQQEAAALVALRNLCGRECDLTPFAKIHFILIAVLGDRLPLDRIGVLRLAHSEALKWERNARSEDRAHGHVQRFLINVFRQFLITGQLRHHFARTPEYYVAAGAQANNQNMEQQAEPPIQVTGHPSGQRNTTISFTSHVAENWVRPSSPIPEAERLEQQRRARETVEEARLRLSRAEEECEKKEQRAKEEFLQKVMERDHEVAEAEIQRELRKNAKLVADFEAQEKAREEEAQESQVEKEFQQFLDEEHRQGRFGSTRAHFESERKYTTHAMNQQARGLQVSTKEQWLCDGAAELARCRDAQDEQRPQVPTVHGHPPCENNVQATPSTVPRYFSGHQVQSHVQNVPMSSTGYALEENNLQVPSTHVAYNPYLMNQHGRGQQTQYPQVQPTQGQESQSQYSSPQSASVPPTPALQQTPVRGYQARQTPFNVNQGQQVQVNRPYPHGTTSENQRGGVQGYQMPHDAPKNSPMNNSGRQGTNTGLQHGGGKGYQMSLGAPQYSPMNNPGQGFRAPARHQGDQGQAHQTPQDPPVNINGQYTQGSRPQMSGTPTGGQAGPGKGYQSPYHPRNPLTNIHGNYVQGPRTGTPSGGPTSSFWGEFRLLSTPRTIAECKALENEVGDSDEDEELPQATPSTLDKQNGGAQAPRKTLPLKNGKRRAL